MGFTAPICTCCGEPIVGYHAVSEGMAPEWMMHVVALRGEYISGTVEGVYDGYGRVRLSSSSSLKELVMTHIGLDRSEVCEIHDEDGWFDCRHAQCHWAKVWGHRSESSPCQGWFIESDLFELVPYTPDADEYVRLAYELLDEEFHYHFSLVEEGEEFLSYVKHSIGERVPVEWMVETIKDWMHKACSSGDFISEMFAYEAEFALRELTCAS